MAQHASWHYKWNAKKIELMNRNWQVNDFSEFIKGKHGFYNGGKTEKKLKSFFWLKKIGQYWSRVHRKMKNRNIWGGMFNKKSWFCQYFHEIIMTLDFWGYNGAPLLPQKSRIRETKHLSTDADSSTDAIGGWTKAKSEEKKTFFCAAILDHFKTKMFKC